MKKVCWVSDEPNWAYDINAKALSARMPMYEHHYVYSAFQIRQEVLDSMDLIVAMNPAAFPTYCEHHWLKIVSILDSVRATIDVKKEMFGKARGIICCNNFLYAFAKGTNSNVVLQPNGADLNHYHVPQSRPDRPFTFGFAGNCEGVCGDYKGYPVYLKAQQLMSGDVTFLSAQRGKSQIGPGEMVERFYHNIDCLVLLSCNEGCSNVIAEALACGIPVICTKVGYHGETLVENRQCIFVTRNVESVYNAMVHISSSMSRLNTMRTEARKFAEKNHDITKVVQTYIKMFEECLT